MPNAPTAPVEPLAYSIPQAAAALSVSPRQVYILAERDGLPTIKIGGRRLVPVAAFRAWFAAQPADGRQDGKRGPDDRE
jgi:excisionase family DNA binding protein